MMPAERVAMRHVREIIRLKFSAGISTREITRRLGIAASTVRETLRRFEGAGLGTLGRKGFSAFEPTLK
jgi:transposase